MSRWRAALIHLSLSFLVFLVALGLIRFLWYPEPYFQAIGAERLLALLVGVDLVLGPLITLIIFKSGKKGLKFDLSVIALAQMTALVYGLHVVVLARPAYVVFTLDRFNVMAANEIDFTGAKPPFDEAGWSGPQLVSAVRPESLEEAQQLLFSAATGGADLQNLARYYRPYDTEIGRALAHGKPLSVLLAKHADAKSEVNDFLSAHHKREDEVVFLPMVSKKQDMSAIVDKASGALLGAVAVDPW